MSGRRRARQRPLSGRVAAKWIGSIIATVLSLTVFTVSAYAWASYRTFQSHVRTVDAIPSDSKNRPQKGIEGKTENILLVGDDDRTGATRAQLQLMHTGDDGGGVNTDTMMILHIPSDGAQAVGISLPRDSWVNIPGHGMNKLNAAYALGSQNGAGVTGGTELLIETVEGITGLTIDHYIAVSMLGFLDIAQALGPIQVCLKQAAVDPYSGTNLPAGVSTLNASQALAFVRQRHNLPLGDIDREIRQQYFLSAELRKLTSAGVLLNPFKINKLISSVSSSLVMDPDLANNIVQFADQMQNLTAGKVTYATLPYTGTPTIYPYGSAISIVAPDWAAIPAFIAKAIGEPASYTNAKAVPKSLVTVTVVNGSNEQGAASTATDALNALGFHASIDQASFTTPAPDASNITTLTTIQYRAGQEGQAKELAKYVPGVAVVESSKVEQVTLTLGTDNLKIKSLATPKPSSSSTPTTEPKPRSSSPNTPAPSPTPITHSYGNMQCID